MPKLLRYEGNVNISVNIPHSNLKNYVGPHVEGNTSYFCYFFNCRRLLLTDFFWNYFSSLITHFYTFFFPEEKTNKSQVLFFFFFFLVLQSSTLVRDKFNVCETQGISKLVNFLYPILMTHHNNKMQKRKALAVDCYYDK